MRALGERSLSFEWVLLRLDGRFIVARSSSEHVLRLRCAREFFVAAIAVFWVSCVFRRVFVVIKVGFCPDLDFYVVLLGKKSFEAIMGGERVGKRSKSFTTIRSSKGVIIVGGIMH